MIGTILTGLGIGPKVSKWGFRIVMAAALAGVAIWFVKSRDAALLESERLACASRITTATNELIQKHEKRVAALMATVAELEQKVNDSARQLKQESDADLQTALINRPDLVNQKCLPAAVNKAIKKRIRKR